MGEMNITQIVGLLARHFWFSFLYVLTSIQLGLAWKVVIFRHYLHGKLLKWAARVTPFLVILTFAGCATSPKHDYIAPSPIAVVSSVSSSAAAAVALGGYVQPGGEKAYTELTNSLNEAQIAVGQYVSKVDDQARQLTAAQNEVVYWHDKQIKALKELWTWRLIALSTILCVVTYIGIKTAWRFTF
jgi:glucan phosphoethanolaminetransferase (alkaline phosphatase superfamily)